jgi:excinuclease ABC subunit B
MARSPKTPRLSTGKASRPELKPLDPYLAELLNPAINREREEREGFAERQQETYAHGEVTDVDPTLAKALNLKARTTARDRGRGGSLAADGVSATVEA